MAPEKKSVSVSTQTQTPASSTKDGSKYGSKIQVMDGVKTLTRGKLTQSDLMINKRGKVVSKKQHERGLAVVKNLVNYINNKKPATVQTSASTKAKAKVAKAA